MPWKVGSKTKKGWQILKKTANNQWKVDGYSSTRAMAQKAVRARYANSEK